MNKKILSVIAALTICAGFTACSKDDSSSDNSSAKDSSVPDSSVTDTSSLPDSSQEDSSLPDSSEPDSSQPEDSKPDDSTDSEVSVTYMTVQQVTEAFLTSLEDGNTDESYSYCSEDFSADLSSKDFSGIIFDEQSTSYQEFTTIGGDTVTVGTVFITFDGKILSDYAFVTVVSDGQTNVIADISLSVFPTDSLVDMGVNPEDIVTPRPEDPELGFKNAQAIAVMCGDIIADAQSFGQSIPDGVYTKNDGSDLCDSINANLGFQGITAHDYEITISGGSATEVSVFDENGTKIESYKA